MQALVPFVVWVGVGCDAAADTEHGALSQLIVARYLTVPALQAQARAIVQRKLELQWDMWDTYRFF